MSHTFVLPKFSRRRVLRFAVALSFALLPFLLTASPTLAAPEVVAQIDGHHVSRAELEAFAADALRSLELQRTLVLEEALPHLIEQKLLQREAEERGVDLNAMLSDEMRQRTTEVTEADIETWFSANQHRVRQPKDVISDQIRGFLQQQRVEEARLALTQELRSKYKVVSYLEPMRHELDLSGAPSKGPDEAPITLVEFSDFQCPYCQRINPTLDEVRQTYGDQVKVVFMQFPLTSLHPQAFQAAEAALCADAQGTFWPMHDAIFAQPKNLTADELKSRAASIDLDADVFAQCLDGGEMKPKVRAQIAQGSAAGVTGTPMFFVNGRLLELKGGQPPMQQIRKVIDDELERQGR